MEASPCRQMTTFGKFSDKKQTCFARLCMAASLPCPLNSKFISKLKKKNHFKISFVVIQSYDAKSSNDRKHENSSVELQSSGHREAPCLILNVPLEPSTKQHLYTAM